MHMLTASPPIPTKASRGAPSRGFTIVELLTVIVVIAILAAISIVAYVGIQNAAHDTAIQNDLSNLAKRAEAYRATEGRYPIHTRMWTVQMGVGLSISEQSYGANVFNRYYCLDKSHGGSFGIVARSKTGQTFTISSKSGIKKDSGGPSWGAACGAYGETDVNKVVFSYKYHRDNGWMYKP